MVLVAQLFPHSAQLAARSESTFPRPAVLDVYQIRGNVGMSRQQRLWLITVRARLIRPLLYCQQGVQGPCTCFSRACGDFGQGPKMNMSRLCTLKSGTESMRQPEKYETQGREKLWGKAKNTSLNPWARGGRAL